MSELRGEKRALREKKRAVGQKLGQLRTEVGKLEDENSTLIDMVKNWCIKGRNEYSRQAIK